MVSANEAVNIIHGHNMHKSSITEFSMISTETVTNIINKSSSKSCSLEPIPTCILKSCLPVLATTITNIVNLSLSAGHVPPLLKTACVVPRLKKKSLDPDELSSYRPISNLPFLSKTLERIVAAELNTYLTDSNLFSSLQSAYRRHHSVETALLRVANDFLVALDNGNEVLLVLLDYTAAFDTVNHSILLHRLEHRFGISGTVLCWLKSYLNDRSQYVKVDGFDSSSISLNYGVPQGSVLGPLLFTLYVSPIEDIIKHHGLDAMFYADDTQIYIALNAKERSTDLQRLEKCAADIKSWSVENFLILNDSKTEIFHVFSNFSRNLPSTPEVKVGNSTILPQGQVKDLGVFFDKHMNLKSHISSICSSASFALRNIGKIRKHLDRATTERLVHAFVSSRLDNCNSLLFGLPLYQIERLQRIQNTAARIVTLSSIKEHITPILNDRHWLTIHNRIKFKILLLTYKVLNGFRPTYLSELIQPYKNQRNLRSNNQYLLRVPKSKTTTFGDRAFSVCAPKLWNNLPSDVKSSPSIDIFKKKLKTYLFSN